jgi:DNA invertase Pin-like site-specific DNA recombinase
VARIGYARVSSSEQSLERQLKALESCSKVFQEKVSGKSLKRSELASMVDYLRDQDVVVITELDRLGRNNKELTEVMETIRKKGATLEILSFPTFSGIEDTNLRELLTNLILEIYKYQAESERTRIKERQRQGIQLAKEQGRYKGRQPTFSRLDDPTLCHAVGLYNSGQYNERSQQTNRYSSFYLQSLLCQTK